MRHLLTLWLLLVVTGPALSADKPTARELAFFEKKIRPLLVQHCYKCHSRQAKTVEAGLLLDSRQGWMTGGENGAVIAAGSPGESLLIQEGDVGVERPDVGIELIEQRLQPLRPGEARARRLRRHADVR